MFNSVCGCRASSKDCPNSWGIQLPLGQETVGWEPTLQSRRGYTIEIHTISTGDCSQPVDIEESVFDFQRIEGPLDVPDAPGKRLTPLLPFELRAKAPIAVTLPDGQHVRVEVRLRPILALP